MIALWLTLLACTPSLDEPANLAYDHAACDHCGMMISDPRFAAQLATDEERVAFDDPACAFRYIADHGPAVRHVWFQDATSEAPAWLDWHQVGFVKADGAPMDGGLAAVPLVADGAIPFSAASSRLLGGAR